jgi:hypothetical protein
MLCSNQLSYIAISFEGAHSPFSGLFCQERTATERF